MGINVPQDPDRDNLIAQLTEAFGKEVNDTGGKLTVEQDTGSTVSTGQSTNATSSNTSIPVSNQQQAPKVIPNLDPVQRVIPIFESLAPPPLQNNNMFGPALFDTGLRSFSGDDNHLIRVWISQFEEYALLMQWSDMQKLVVAKKSLNGTTSIVSQLKVYRNWDELKNSLLEEFDQVRTSKEIHSLLSMTKKRHDESLLAYSVRMQELAVQGGIEDSSLIQYIIDGINDSNTNKILLYGASNMQEFKRKLNVYRVYKTQASPSLDQFSVPTPATNTPIQSRSQSIVHRPTATPLNINANEYIGPPAVLRCTFCNRRNHDESVCRLKRISCYICKQLGHKVQACPNRSNTVQVCNQSDNTRAMQKCITFNGLKWKALIDTGSDVSIAKQNIFNQIQPQPILRPVNIKLNGVGNGSFVTIGAADLNVIMDSSTYKIEMFVVRNEDTQSDIIIGNNFLANHRVVIEKGVVSVFSPEHEMYNINIEDNTAG